MDREIKFRAKTLFVAHVWVYGCAVIQINGQAFLFENTDSLAGVEDDGDMESSAYIVEGLMEVDPDTIGQDTGLKDKNGKEIYEGDIIESKRYRHIVMYDKNLAGFCSANVKYPEDLCGLNQQWINECGKVVIGNVTDNPELME